MPVPMVVKPPAASAPTDPTDDRIAETVDLVPTIADLLEVELPWEVDGASLVGPEPETHERGIYARGETVSTDDDPVDVDSDGRPHLGRGSASATASSSTAYGPDGDLIGRRVPARRRSVGADPDACWSPPTRSRDPGLGRGRDRDRARRRPSTSVSSVDDRGRGHDHDLRRRDERDHALFALGRPHPAGPTAAPPRSGASPTTAGRSELPDLLRRLTPPFAVRGMCP